MNLNRALQRDLGDDAHRMGPRRVVLAPPASCDADSSAPMVWLEAEEIAYQ